MSFGIPYSDNENAMVIKLRESGLVGQRLTDQFRIVYPNRSHKSVLNKMDQLRRHKIIREKQRKSYQW
jgi:hypothetical protein